MRTHALLGLVGLLACVFLFACNDAGRPVIWDSSDGDAALDAAVVDQAIDLGDLGDGGPLNDAADRIDADALEDLGPRFDAGGDPDFYGGDITPIEEDTPYLNRLSAGAQGFYEFSLLAQHGEDEAGPYQIVKFFLEHLDQTPVCYLQNTVRTPLHYDFVHGVLGRSWTVSQYEYATYEDPQRTQMAGTLLFYPHLHVASGALGGTARAPLLLTFFPNDTLTPAQALRAYQVLQDSLAMLPANGNDGRLFYLPAGDVQQAALVQQLPAFRDAGALWLLTTEFYGQRSFQGLNPGESYGTLHYLTPEEFVSQPLSIRDIVILSSLPNLVPLVGGTITEQLQTPLAHVNIAAQNRGTPNMALLGAARDGRIAPHIGGLVHLVVRAGSFDLSAADQASAEAYWRSLIPGEIRYPEADLQRRGPTPLTDITFDDAVAFGVKAANVAELGHLTAAPGNHGFVAPPGFAVPFAHYEDHLLQSLVTRAACMTAMAGCVDAGDVPIAACDRAFPRCQQRTADSLMLHDYIVGLLADADFQLDTALRAAELAGLRAIMANAPLDADFAAELDAAVAETFGDQTIRLRSSTNAEDLKDFSGAGLYSSFSAERADPDRLPTAIIRQVWASVWNRGAFEEREFRGIDHLSVRMGVLAQPAYPDERANGVAITSNLTNPEQPGVYVNVQQGEVPVTNPEGGALPEIFTIVMAPSGGVQVVRERFSSLSPTVALLSDTEIATLFGAVTQVQWHFAPLYETSPQALALDIEFKFHGPERTLIIKQARPYRPVSTR